jgi:hypothetical protein
MSSVDVTAINAPECADESSDTTVLVENNNNNTTPSSLQQEYANDNIQDDNESNQNTSTSILEDINEEVEVNDAFCILDAATAITNSCKKIFS